MQDSLTLLHEVWIGRATACEGHHGHSASTTRAVAASVDVTEAEATLDVWPDRNNEEELWTSLSSAPSDVQLDVSTQQSFTHESYPSLSVVTWLVLTVQLLPRLPFHVVLNYDIFIIRISSSIGNSRRTLL